MVKRGIGPDRCRARAPHVADAALHHRHHVVLADERHLDVDLGELRLAVGARILVAHAARDLHVATEPADHQDLLEDLRRLRQRVERPRDGCGWHEVVARAFGRRLDQHRRLDLDEVARVEVIAHRLHDAVAHGEIALHPRTAQIEIAVPRRTFSSTSSSEETTNGGVSSDG